jgi:dTDP-4-dehydrorhamnose reductase
MKKIWICGAAGMLGSHFTRLLTEKKIPFVANDYQQMDITQLDVVSDFVRLQKITHIINCAAYTQVDQAENEQQKAYLINAMGPYHLGVAGRRHQARVIHFSTDYVFDGRSQQPYTEKHACAPLGAYGISKWAGELKLLDAYEDACIIRTSWLYGVPGKNFVETMLRLMSEKETLRVVNDQIGRPTYCQDLAEITLELLDADGIFHFANSGETSWYHFANEIKQQAQQLEYPLKITTLQPIATHEYPTLTQRPAYSTLSTKKIEQFLNKVPRPWQHALNAYLKLYKYQ